MTHRLNLVPRLGAALGIVLAAACAPDSNRLVEPDLAPPAGPSRDVTATATDAVVTPSIDTIAVGDTVKLTLTGTGITATTQVYWRSSAPTVATVGTWTGSVVGVAPGVTTVSGTAQMTGYPGSSAKIVVIDAPAPAPAPTTGTPTPTPGALAELPRSYVNTAVPAPTGRQIVVNAGQSLQNALDAAQPGDVVLLQPGATFTGNFVLGAKSGTGWITVRTAAPDANLPPAGTRMKPSYAAQLPKILAPNSWAAIRTAAGAHHWRLLGLEVGAISTAPKSDGLVLLGDGTSGTQRSLSVIPTNLVLERMYIHGFSTLNVRRCVALNSAYTAIVDSYLDDCHSGYGDSQAIWGWNGPGPYKIVNNYMAAGHEVVGFGGPTADIAGQVPADIEIRRNHITRPVAWKGVWVAKNLFEMKGAERVLFEENLLENNWLGAQPGWAIVLQGLSDDGLASWVRIWDVTIRKNVIRNTAAGLNLLSRVTYLGLTPTNPMRRVNVTDNLIVVGGGPNGEFAGNMKMFQVLGDINDLTITRNTAIGVNGTTAVMDMIFDGTSPTVRLGVADNVFGPTTYGVMGNGTNGINATKAKYGPDAVFANNVFTAMSATGNPTTNFYPLTLVDAGLGLAPTGDYHFAPTGALATAIGTRQTGANIDALTQFIASALTP